jgi:hypothetical protein
VKSELVRTTGSVHDGLVRTLRIGSGAGFADDRIEPAVELAERGELDYLVFECLAERTVTLAQLDRLRDPDAGYNEWLRDRMEAVLPACAARGTKIITNMGGPPTRPPPPKSSRAPVSPESRPCASLFQKQTRLSTWDGKRRSPPVPVFPGQGAHLK